MFRAFRGLDDAEREEGMSRYLCLYKQHVYNFEGCYKVSVFRDPEREAATFSFHGSRRVYLEDHGT